MVLMVYVGRMQKASGSGCRASKLSLASLAEVFCMPWGLAVLTLNPKPYTWNPSLESILGVLAVAT